MAKRLPADAPQRPVLKWAGSKLQLVPEILRRLPPAPRTYYEPFAGSAAVFFALAAEGRIDRAVLADSNPELIATYRALQGEVERVLDVLAEHAARHSEDHFYAVRDLEPGRLTLAERGARLIYLNRTCFNGLYRVNASGKFNVPFGRYRNPLIHQPERLRRAARLLAGVALHEQDFERSCAAARPGDAVYLDPPYLPVSRTAHFSAYAREKFGLAEHERLATAFRDLSDRGVAAVLSNSETPQTRDLYRGLLVSTVSVERFINADASRRGGVQELLVVTEPARPRAATRGRIRT